MFAYMQVYRFSYMHINECIDLRRCICNDAFIHVLMCVKYSKPKPCLLFYGGQY